MARIDLHQKLVKIGNENKFKVYFVPPSTNTTNMQFVYPCLLYTKSRPQVQRADDKKYFKYDQYDLVFMTKDPDSTIPDLIEDSLSYTNINRGPYVTEGIYNYSLTCYHK